MLVLDTHDANPSYPPKMLPPLSSSQYNSNFQQSYMNPNMTTAPVPNSFNVITNSPSRQQYVEEYSDSEKIALGKIFKYSLIALICNLTLIRIGVPVEWKVILFRS